MTEINYKYGCTRCGRYVECQFKQGIGAIGKFSDDDLSEKVDKICICNKDKGEK